MFCFLFWIFPTSWCNSGVGDVLFPFEYFLHMFWAFIMMQLWCWGCSAVPQGQIGFYLHIFSLLYSFCPTLRCNSGNGHWAVLIPSYIMMQLWCRGCFVSFWIFPTSWCNSGVGDVLLCLRARLVSICTSSLFSIHSALHSDATLVMGSSISFLHHDATLM